MKRMMLVPAILMMSTFGFLKLMLLPASSAQTSSLVQLQQALAASDGVAGDSFGHSSAIDGDRAIVGAHRDRIGSNSTQGSAYVFIRTGTNWSQQTKLIASDGAAADNFGSAVAISGNTIVVGSPSAMVGSDLGRGAAYIFTRNGTVWSQEAKLLAADGRAQASFGTSVTIDGDTVVVGAPGDRIGTVINQGSAYVFVRSAGVWAQQQKLVASDAFDGHRFGGSVGVSGDTAAIGASGVEQSRGAVYAFTRTGAVWSQQQKLVASDRQPGDRLGWSVTIDQDTIAGGADFDTTGTSEHHGSAYVFLRLGAVWTEQQKLVASDAAPFDGFGGSIAVSGDRVVVGLLSESGLPAGNRFAAYTFERLGSQWTQQQRLTSTGSAGDGFSYSVGISDGTLIVGAPGNGPGATYIYVPATITNTSPAITPAAAITREQGSAPSPSTIATVTDTEDTAANLVVTATAPQGISVSGITNSSGVISAIIGADCTAATGPATIALQVADSGGLTATANLTVNVTANGQPPSISCTSDITVAADAGACSAAVNYASPVANDDCPGSSVVCAPAAGSVFPTGATTVTCIATDVANNTSSCSFTITVNANLRISPASQSFAASGGTGSVAVTAASGCNWTAVSNDAWITITSGRSGVGNGRVDYLVAPNVATSPRTGTITAAGQSFTVTQQGASRPSANLSITNNANVNSVTVGERLTYTIVVTNNGPSDAVNVVVVDDARGTSSVTQGSVRLGANNLSWSVGALASGAGATLTLEVTTGPPTLFNTADVSSPVFDPDTSNNRAVAVTTVNLPPPADLAITRMVASPTPVVIGSPLTYTIEITNHGPNSAVNVVLFTLMSINGARLDDVTFVSASSNEGVCSLQPGRPLRCDFEKIFSGNTATVTLVVIPTRVRPSPGAVFNGPLTNAAWVESAAGLVPTGPRAANPDPDLANNRATVETIVNPTTGSDLAITRMETNRNPIVVGETVTYTVEAINYGPDPAGNVILNFGLMGGGPPTRSIQSASSTQGTFRISGTADLRCDVGTLSAGATVRVTVVVGTEAKRFNRTETFGALADIYVAGRRIGQDTDPNRRDNTARAVVTVNPATGADLAVTLLTDSPDPVVAGAYLTYNIEVTNFGPDQANNVELLTLTSFGPRGRSSAPLLNIVFVSASVSQGGFAYQSAGLMCSLGTLARGARATITVVAMATTSGPLTNYAAVSTAGVIIGNDPDPNSANNIASATTDVLPPRGVDLAITQFTASPDPVQPRGLLSYTLEVRNNGPAPASGVLLEVQLADNVAFMRGNAGLRPIRVVQGRVICDLGTLLSGQTATVTLVTRVTDAGAVTSIAGVSCDFRDLDTGNNTAAATSAISAVAAILGRPKPEWVSHAGRIA